MNETGKKLHLNRSKAILGGVCAGYADYFGIDAFFIRLGFVIATFTWPLSILVYVISYFCMDDKKTSLGEVCNNISNSKIGRHFKNVDYKKRLYKSRRNKKISGVCAGIGDYLEINPFFIRLALVLSLFFGPFAVVAYIIAAVIMDEDPDQVGLQPHGARQARRERRRQRRHYRRHGRGMDDMDAGPTASADFVDRPPPFDKRDLKTCTQKFSDLEKKLRRLEATITSKKFKLHSELNRMSN